LPHAVHETARVGRTDVHPGTLADRLETLEHGEMAGGIVGGHAALTPEREGVRPLYGARATPPVPDTRHAQNRRTRSAKCPAIETWPRQPRAWMDAGTSSARLKGSTS